MFTARVITVSDRSYRGERPDGGGPLVRQILEEEMTGAASLAVRLEVDAHTGHTWYDAK